jgi:hypothetical protein
MIILDYILWVVFVLSLVLLVMRFSERFPKVLDMDITDPLSVFEVDSDDDEKSDICVVCERKKGSEPLLICQNENCINKSDTD